MPKKRIGGKVAYLPPDAGDATQTTTDSDGNIWVTRPDGIKYYITPIAQKLDQTAVDETLKGVFDVLNDMPWAKAQFTGVGGTYTTRKRGIASMNGLGRLSLNEKDYSTYQEAVKQANNPETVSTTLHGVGTHEAGHLIVRSLINEVYPQKTNLERATMWSKHKLEDRIIRVAAKRAGANYKISRYGSTNNGEKVAEAISDVYSNGAKANPYSQVIVDVIKDMQKKKSDKV